MSPSPGFGFASAVLSRQGRGQLLHSTKMFLRGKHPANRTKSGQPGFSSMPFPSGLSQGGKDSGPSGLADQGFHFAYCLEEADHDGPGDDAMADVEFFHAFDAGDRLNIGVC